MMQRAGVVRFTLRQPAERYCSSTIGKWRREVKLCKALAIVTRLAAAQRDSPPLAEALVILHELAAAEAKLLDGDVDALDRACLAARLPRRPGLEPSQIARALRRASDAALSFIPPIDRRTTRDDSKRALRAVAIVERFAAALDPRPAAAAASAA